MPRRKSLFAQISKGDLVTIHDNAGERKGRATNREYGNWVLVLQFGVGTAIATRENVTAVTKPKALTHVPRAGQRLIFDDGRPRHRHCGEVVNDTYPDAMLVQFDDEASPNLIHFNDPEWMDYITFQAAGSQPLYQPGDFVKAEFSDDDTSESEWMWVEVDRSDDDRRLIFGRLDNQPIVLTKLKLGQEIAISYDLVREHRQAHTFKPAH